MDDRVTIFARLTINQNGMKKAKYLFNLWQVRKRLFWKVVTQCLLGNLPIGILFALYPQGWEKYCIIMDCHLLCQKICHIISVIKTNNGVFVVFKTKSELKC